MKQTVIILLFLLLQMIAKAQFLDSLQIYTGTSVSVSSKDFLPLWLVANRFGVITDQQFDLSTHLRVTNSHHLGPGYDSVNPVSDKAVYIGYGIDLYNNDHLSKTLFQEAFVSARYKNLSLHAGRFKQIIGEVDPDLSSGSLGVSGNALPIPKVTLAIAYTPIPFTNGWAQFKGQISHGWMGNDQYMKHAFLHEKNLYVRIGKNKLKVYGGIQHYAIWGGSNGSLKLDRSLKGFFNVLAVNEANDGSVPDGILPNRAGDHRGVIEAGVEWENEKVRVDLNNQTPFDMGQGIDARNIDRLLSLNIINKNNGAKLKKVVIEFLHTKQMNDFYASRYRESYYNNGIYKTGWEYEDHIIGTPMFINRVRGTKFLNNIQPYDWDAPSNTIPGLSNIIVNRVVGGNIGVIYAINQTIISKTKITYMQNYGRYATTDYNHMVSQWYSLQEISWTLPNNKISVTGSLAYDWGRLYDNFGSMIGLQWQLR